jgi:hypothetical protein
MRFAATADEIKRGQMPHNLFVSGLFVFDLLLTPAVLVLKLGIAGLLGPLFCSSTLIAYIYLRSKKTTVWFVDMHWKLAFMRAQWLVLGYAATAVLIFAAWLISLTARDPNMGHIMWTALTRIALMPTLIMVLVTAVLEASAIPMVNKCEVPDKLASKFPPPQP